MRLRIWKQTGAEAFWFTKITFSVQLLRDVIWLSSGITHKTSAPRWFTKLLEVPHDGLGLSSHIGTFLCLVANYHA